MYKLSILCLLTGFLGSCVKEDTSDCPDKICTANFAMIMLSFTDKEGKGVSVKDFSTVNQRTGDTIKSNQVPSLSFAAGTYVVVDDSSVEKLSTDGDDIKVSGTYEATGQTKTAILNVAGGKCACHIEKKSGPEKIAFD